MRVIAGKYKGRRLLPLKTPGVRPTSDNVREAVFSILANHVVDARVLDLFAGTGAMGIEALSRGARRCVFVEKNRAPLALIHGNLALVKAGENARVLALDAAAGLAPPLLPRAGFDLVFLDPPYSEGHMERALDALVRQGLLAPGALVVAEHDIHSPIEHGPDGLVLEDRRRYGKTLVSFFSPAE
jgi:16S rRNA (guanine(966)-N(2))-methyltransferase RsmD